LKHFAKITGDSPLKKKRMPKIVFETEDDDYGGATTETDFDVSKAVVDRHYEMKRQLREIDRHTSAMKQKAL